MLEYHRGLPRASCLLSTCGEWAPPVHELSARTGVIRLQQSVGDRQHPRIIGVYAGVTGPATWNRSQYLAERARELAALEREAVKAERRLFAQTLGGCVVCSAVGVGLVAWSLRMVGVDAPQIVFWTGLLLGNGGMFLLLLRHFARSLGGEF